MTTIITKLKSATFIIGLSSVLAGCSGMSIGEPEYSCSGIPDGLRCMSAQQVYEMTDSDDYKEKIHENSMIAKRIKEESAENISPEELQRRIKLETEKSIITKNSNNQPRITAFENKVMPGVVPYPVKKVLPLRTPAKVMRIAFRAWESTNGALHVPGYVYSEIESRRWQIGDREVDLTSKITALQVISSGNGAEQQVQKASQRVANGLAAGASEAAYGVDKGIQRRR